MLGKLDAFATVVPRAKGIGQWSRRIGAFAEILATASAWGAGVLVRLTRIQLFREGVTKIPV